MPCLGLTSDHIRISYDGFVTNKVCQCPVSGSRLITDHSDIRIVNY